MLPNIDNESDLMDVDNTYGHMHTVNIKKIETTSQTTNNSTNQRCLEASNLAPTISSLLAPLPSIHYSESEKKKRSRQQIEEESVRKGARVGGS